MDYSSHDSNPIDFSRAASHGSTGATNVVYQDPLEVLRSPVLERTNSQVNCFIL